MVSSTPRPHLTPGKEPVPILLEAGWALGPVWTGGKSRPHRDSIPDRPARRQYILITYINSVVAERKCLSILTPKLVTGHDPGTVPPTFTSHSLLCCYFAISSSPMWTLLKKFPHHNSVCPLFVPHSSYILGPS